MLRPSFKLPEAPSSVPPPPPAAQRVVRPGAAALPPAPYVTSAPGVEGNFGESEESNKEKTGWVVLDFLALAASIALCVLLWNQFFLLDGAAFF
jgi:hypothetical protein